MTKVFTVWLFALGAALAPCRSIADEGGLGSDAKGSDLVRLCEGRSGSTQAERDAGRYVCAGYVIGFLDGYQLTADIMKPAKPLMCLPADGVRHEDVIRVVVQWLGDNPLGLQQSARSDLFRALATAYRCK